MSKLASIVLLSIVMIPTLAVAAESDVADHPLEEINGYPATSQAVKGLTAHYPAGRWTVETDEIDDRRSMIRLVAKMDASIVLSIFVTRGMPAVDAHYLNHPNFVNTAVLLPVVLDLTQKDESRIFFSVGTSSVPGGWDTSTRATVLMEDKHAIHIEACHLLHEASGNMVSALVSTRTRSGQVLEDPDYSERVAEAYAIIQNLKIGN